MKMIPAGTFLRGVIDPGLSFLSAAASVKGNTSAARRFLLTVAMVESRLQARAQVVAGRAAGPARGWWQFELPTIGLLMRHDMTGPRLNLLCAAAWVEFDDASIWRAVEGHDILACGVARLALLADPHPIPDDEKSAWDCYAYRVWRPGAVSRMGRSAECRDHWNKAWATSGEAVA